MDYVSWATKDEGNSCVLERIQGFERDWDLKKGLELAASFPDDAFFTMHPAYKRNIRVCDNVINLGRLIIVSRRLKDFLEHKQIPAVEYLRVSILNHKNHVASAEHYILNPIGPQDCLDRAQSVCHHSPILPANIVGVDRLILDPARIDPAVPVFRLAGFDVPVIVRRDLADELSAAGFTGLFWGELQDYGQ